MVTEENLHKLYGVMRKMFTLIIMVLTITLIVGCNSNDLQYKETEKKLAGLTVYEYTSNQEHCPEWAYQTLFETEDYIYVYDNQCPTAYFILEDNEYIEITSYIKLNSITNQEVEESGIGRKIMK